MTDQGLLAKAKADFRLTPGLSALIAIVLLATGLALGAYNESLGRAERIRQATTQAEILASSVAGSLAFDDTNTTREYIGALKADRDVQAVGVYDQAGLLVASFVLSGAPVPARSVGTGPAARGPEIVLTRPVVQGPLRLGSVYLRTSYESLPRRATRYVGISLLIVMASILVGSLGSSNATIREAHRKLKDEVAEREKAEAALRQSQKMEAMGQLTGGVAHDFNNLLMVASGGLDLLDRTQDPARRERLKAGIRQAIERGASLTQQLLAFARRTPLRPEVLDLGAALGGMHTLLDRSLREDIAVTVRPDPDLWPVEVDPSQLEVAVLNIALNARDAMPGGGVILITASNVAANDSHPFDHVRLSIADSGVGMPAEMVARVFEPFFTTKEVGKGTGLGLSQVYGFARASGGEAVIESEAGVGSTVRLLIPRSAKPLPVAAAATPQVAARAEGRRHILLVEDDDNVARLVSEMLAELDYLPERVASAAAAVQTLASGRAFDLMFSDMVMPGEMGGLDLVHHVARQHPTLPVLLTTGYSSAAATAAAEGVRLLVKPYSIEALAAELKAALG